MKKILVVILVVAVLLFVAYIVPVTQTNIIAVRANFVTVVPQLEQIENWKKWYPEINKSWSADSANYSITGNNKEKIYTISIPEKKYIVHCITPLYYQVEITKNDREQSAFALEIHPSEKQDSLSIQLTSKTNLFNKVFSNGDESKKAIEALKSYFENPKIYYGFDVKMDTIRNPIIASIVFRETKTKIFPKIKTAYLQLLDYVKDNGLKIVDHPSISYSPIINDSFNVVVGLPVNQSAQPKNDIRCLMLPAKGKVLTGYYEGKFADREKIYQALSRFMSDDHLSMPAVSFERYLNDSIPSSDSSVIKMELNFPVY